MLERAFVSRRGTSLGFLIQEGTVLAKAYCPNCKLERKFRSQTRIDTFIVRGETFELPVIVDVCTGCGEVRLEEGRDEDLLMSACNLYRSKHDLLQPALIREIRMRYGLSQKAFATLLGMSQATINRYELGALPQETHDNLIRMAAYHEVMLDLIERRGHLLTARQRSRAIRA